jgi:hypothetical protein
MFLGFSGSKVRLQIDATRGYIPNVIIERKKYARVLDLKPSGLRVVWLITMLPIKPKKNVKRKRRSLLLSIV